MSFALPDALFFTGIDWAAETHAVCVMDAAGQDRGRVHDRAFRGRDRHADPPPGPVRRARRHAGRHRAAGRPPGGPAAGGRAPGGAGQAERDQDLAGRRGALGRQVRRRRRRGDRRVPAAARAQAEGRRPLLRPDQGAAHRRAHPRRPGGDAGRGHQPALGAAGGALARRQGHLRRRRVADQPGVPHPLPDPGRRRAPGREADGRVLRQARLLRPPHRRRAARPPALRPGRHHRRGPHRGAARRRARRGRRAHGPERRR